MKVLIASGGSGGHIFPAVSLAKELLKTDTEIIFVASRRYLDEGVLEGTPYRKFYLSANPMPYKFGWRTFVFTGKLVIDSICSFFILLRTRPDVVVGFGGYTAGAVVLLASIMRRKTVIHEQNVIPGRTNRLLDGLVSEIAVSFKETEKYFNSLIRWGFIKVKYQLTKRHLEIAKLACTDMDNRIIAKKLGIRPYTLKSHFSYIYSKVGIKKRICLLHRFIADSFDFEGDLVTGRVGLTSGPALPN